MKSSQESSGLCSTTRFSFLWLKILRKECSYHYRCPGLPRSLSNTGLYGNTNKARHTLSSKLIIIYCCGKGTEIPAVLRIQRRKSVLGRNYGHWGNGGQRRESRKLKLSGWRGGDNTDVVSKLLHQGVFWTLISQLFEQSRFLTYVFQLTWSTDENIIPLTAVFCIKAKLAISICLILFVHFSKYI